MFKDFAIVLWGVELSLKIIKTLDIINSKNSFVGYVFLPTQM